MRHQPVPLVHPPVRKVLRLLRSGQCDSLPNLKEGNVVLQVIPGHLAQSNGTSQVRRLFTGLFGWVHRSWGPEQTILLAVAPGWDKCGFHVVDVPQY